MLNNFMLKIIMFIIKWFTHVLSQRKIRYKKNEKINYTCEIMVTYSNVIMIIMFLFKCNHT